MCPVSLLFGTGGRRRPSKWPLVGTRGPRGGHTAKFLAISDDEQTSDSHVARIQSTSGPYMVT
jgi:hypothetical protein